MQEFSLTDIALPVGDAPSYGHWSDVSARGILDRRDLIEFAFSGHVIF